MTRSAGAWSWVCRDRTLELGITPRVMGVLNVTPDSFSDGGHYATAQLAIDRGRAMVEEGADILDVGGESTRPGAEPVPVVEEIKRVVPVITGLRKHTNALISIDTSKSEVAMAALEAGAHIINDVSAFRGWEGMGSAAMNFKAGVVLMHMQGNPQTMQEHPEYGDPLSEVAAYLRTRRDALIEAGCEAQQVIIDPGIGFGKTLEDNLALLRGIPRLCDLAPVLIGLSRKSMLGAITGREVNDRLAGSLAGLAWSVLQGAQLIRVHDVKDSCDSIKVLTILMDNHGRL